MASGWAAEMENDSEHLATEGEAQARRRNAPIICVQLACQRETVTPLRNDWLDADIAVIICCHMTGRRALQIVDIRHGGLSSLLLMS